MNQALHPARTFPVLAGAGAWLAPFLALIILETGCRSPSTDEVGSGARRDPALEESHPEPGDPDRPSPVLPEKAFFLGEFAALELTITAARDGSVQKVVVSKPSRAKVYDEYTRNWVEKNWKMPPARPGEADLRKFIAPIVYPKGKPRGGSFPIPPYPPAYVRDRVEGLLVLDVTVAASGDVEAAQTVMSSGNKSLDSFTEDWVRRKWKFPPGGERSYRCPFTYLVK